LKERKQDGQTASKKKATTAKIKELGVKATK
jgi:hypothetical protein